MKVNILIIGAGQLGSRHLQGVLKVTFPLSIYVIDPSVDSLMIAQERANEINNGHEVYYYKDWDQLPLAFDIAIIATNSNVRENVIIKLLDTCNVNYLILEKVLFPEVEAYERVINILEKNKIKTWVNHPRRMFQSYQHLKKEMTPSPKIYQVTGGNWGLGCNGLHFIDLFSYLDSSSIKTINTENIDPFLLKSKRNGFIEFSGTITGNLNSGSLFTITSFSIGPTSPTITIFDNDNRYIVQEAVSPVIISMKKESDFKFRNEPFSIENQSSLTTKIIINLIKDGTCSLPTYKEAHNSHMLFVSSLLNNYNQITHSSNKILPIT